MPCAYVPPADGSLSGMLDYLDCQAQTIGGDGYLALAAPSSPANLALTGLITILVAIYGYRLLFGQGPGVRDTVLTLVRIGIVVALATGWGAYRPLFYDLTLHGPAEVTSIVGGAAGLPGATGGLASHIDATDQLFQVLAVADARPTAVSPADPAIAPPLFAGFNTFALGWSRVTFLVGAVGAYAAVRLSAGLLLALGPLFIGFLLFDSTRGLFIGWLRGLAAAALGAVATSIVLGLELIVLEPWLGALVVQRSGGQPIAGAPAQLLAVTLILDVVLVAVVFAVFRVAGSLDVARIASFAAGGAAAGEQRSERFETSRMRAGSTSRIETERSRAALIADAVATIQRREVSSVLSGGSGGARMGGVAQGSAFQGSASMPGRSTASASVTGRRTTGRVSASAGRRDAVR